MEIDNDDAMFQACSQWPRSGPCQCAALDFDEDQDVDLTDPEAFSYVFTGSLTACNRRQSAAKRAVPFPPVPEATARFPAETVSVAAATDLPCTSA